MTLNERTRTLLEGAGIAFQVLPHKDTMTADQAAAATHVAERSFAKVVVVQTAAGQPLMAVVPASRHVDLGALADLAGRGTLAVATEPECRRLFPDCEVGAMPPFGSLYGVPVYLDSCLGASDDIAFQAGSHHEAVLMAADDFARVARAVVGEFCR